MVEFVKTFKHDLKMGGDRKFENDFNKWTRENGGNINITHREQVYDPVAQKICVYIYYTKNK